MLGDATVMGVVSAVVFWAHEAIPQTTIPQTTMTLASTRGDLAGLWRHPVVLMDDDNRHTTCEQRLNRMRRQITPVRPLATSCGHPGCPTMASARAVYSHRLPDPKSDGAPSPLRLHSAGMAVGAWQRRMAVILSVMLLAGCRTESNAATLAPELWTNFQNKPDASTLPSEFDSGQAATASFDQPSAAPFIQGGAYTSVPTGPGRAASYYQTRLRGVVNRVHVRFSFLPGTTMGGRMAFAIQNQAQTGTTIPSMSLHLTVGPEDWNYGVWNGPNNGDSKLQSVGYGQFDPPLIMDGVTEHDVDVSISGDTATLIVDGVTKPPITDSRIGNPTYNGPYLFFECFSTVADTDNRTRFSEVQAWSEGVR
jgi:hypothetical protein